MPIQQDLEQPFNDQYQLEQESMEQEKNRLLSRITASRQIEQPSQPAQPSQPQEGGNYSAGQHLGEIPKAVVGGVTHAVENTMEALDEVWDYAGQHFESLHSAMPDIPLSKGHMWHPEAPVTNTGKITQSISQFMVGFIPAVKAVKALGITAKFGQVASGMVAGAAVDFAVFDPTEGRVMDAIQQLDPELKIPVLSYLTSDETDSAFESRMKNVGEGALMGGLGEIFFKGLKGIKGSIGTRVEAEVAEGAAEGGVRLDEAVGTMENQRLSDATAAEEPLVHAISEEQVKEFSDHILSGAPAEGKTFGSVNISKISGGQDYETLYDTAGSMVKGMFEATGKPVERSWKESRDYFESFGMDKEQIRTAVKGTEGLSDKILGMRMVHADVAQQVDTMAKKIMAQGGTPEELLTFEKGLRVMADVQAAVRGTVSETARALNIAKAKVGPGMIDHDLLDTMVHGTGGAKTIQDKAKRYLALSTNAQKGNFLEKSLGAKTLDAVQFYWINSLLSSPTTWIVNAVSNAAVLGNSIAEAGYAAGKHAITGKGEVSGAVVGDKLMGMWTGLTEALRVGRGGNEGTAYTAFKHEKSAIDPTQASKFDSPIGETGWANSTIGKSMKLVVGIPGRVLMATDELFKTVNYRGHLAMNASITGRRLNLEGDALKKHISDYMSNPKVGEHKDALQYAKKNTFQNDLGTAGKSVQRVVNQLPALRFIMPFIRTPTNIIKYAGEHTPFINKLSSQMKEEIAAGGVRKELAEAKVATGSMLFATAGFMASQGLITGGSHEDYRNGRNDLIGRQAYSVKVGEKYYSFSRLDPFGMFFGLTADMAELIEHSPQEDWGEIAGGLILAFSQNLASKTYLKGLVDFSDGILNSRGDAKATEKWLTNFTSSFIPNFMNQTNRLHMDNQMKEINEFMDNFKKRCYAASGGVMAKRDQITGDQMHYSEALWGGYLQVFTKDVENDPVKREFYESHAGIKKLPKNAVMSVNRHNIPTPLNGQEYDRLQQIVFKEAKVNGKDFHAFLGDLFNTPAYKALPKGSSDDSGTGSRRAVIRKATNLFHTLGNQMLVKENQDIQGRIMAELSKRKQEAFLAMQGEQ